MVYSHADSRPLTVTYLVHHNILLPAQGILLQSESFSLYKSYLSHGQPDKKKKKNDDSGRSLMEQVEYWWLSYLHL